MTFTLKGKDFKEVKELAMDIVRKKSDAFYDSVVISDYHEVVEIHYPEKEIHSPDDLIAVIYMGEEKDGIVARISIME